MTRDDPTPPSERYWDKWHISKDEYDRYIDAKKIRDKRVPKVGSIAPDFNIEKLDKKGQRTGEMFQLSSTRGKPVAIVFGSFTWTPFRNQAGRLNDIYDRYKNNIHFVWVYIKEAHPNDSIGGYRSDYNVDVGIEFNQPKTERERAAVAQQCVSRLKIRMPMLLDDMNNQAEEKYIAWPDRLFVLDAVGLVTYHSALGPEGFNVDEWELAIKAVFSHEQIR